MSVRAGDLHDVVTIQSASGASDGQGGTTTVAPTTVARVPARVVAMNATEVLQSESVGSHGQYEVTIRARPSVSPGHTLIWIPRSPSGMGALTLQVLGVQPMPDRQAMTLTCAVVQ